MDAPPEAESDSDPPIVIIAAAAAGGLLIVVAIMTCWCCSRRKRQSQDPVAGQYRADDRYENGAQGYNGGTEMPPQREQQRYESNGNGAQHERGEARGSRTGGQRSSAHDGYGRAPQGREPPRYDQRYEQQYAQQEPQPHYAEQDLPQQYHSKRSSSRRSAAGGGGGGSGSSRDDRGYGSSSTAGRASAREAAAAGGYVEHRERPAPTRNTSATATASGNGADLQVCHSGPHLERGKAAGVPYSAG